MTNTTNYDLILVEGSDKVNPLTQVNPNFETIDEEMKKNADGGITTATELLTSSVHALLRENSDCPMLRFTATSNYTAGETFTVDGVQVTALTPTGEALGSGAYIIGSEVLGCLKGTLLTLFITGGVATTADNALKLGGELPEYYGKASDVESATQVATAASVLANSCQTQITTINENLANLLTWKKVGSYYLGDACTMPTDWHEAYCICVNVPITIIRSDVSSTEKSYTNGASNSGANASTHVSVLATSSAIKMNRYRYNSSTDISSAEMTVYYR